MLCYKVILQICLSVSRRTFFGWNDLFLDPWQVLLRHKYLYLVGVRGGEIPTTKAWPAESLYSNICETDR